MVEAESGESFALFAGVSEFLGPMTLTLVEAFVDSNND